MIVVLLGKSNSGKTVIAKELQKLGIPKIKTCTTRPKRENETNDDYYFIDNVTFKEYIKHDLFAEHYSYTTEHGIWYYGSYKSDYCGNKSIVLNPYGLEMIKNNIQEDVVSVYINASNKTLKKRIKARDNNSKEAKRRYKADKKDFKNIKSKVNIIINNDGERTPEEIAKQILSCFNPIFQGVQYES